MAAKPARLSFQWVEDLKDYLLEPDSEKAKAMKAYAVFRDVFGDRFVYESAAAGADGYVEGKLVLELKSEQKDWCAGLFQALHYAKRGLAFTHAVVMARHFLALWEVDRLPDDVIRRYRATDPALAPNDAGKRNARETPAAQRKEILAAAKFILPDDVFKQGYKNSFAVYEFKNYLTNVDAGRTRLQINPHNFILKIESLGRFFPTPMEAAHCFYTLVNYWDQSSIIPEPYEHRPDELLISGRNGRKLSPKFSVAPKHHAEFRKFVEGHYVFTNEGSGLSLDYYFSRFDEVLARTYPEFVRQHGIFFTDQNLAQFAIAFALGTASPPKDAVFFDPAGGSGNLVTAQRRSVRYKIVSELQPDLLKIIERRLWFDPEHLQAGFTVVPKTHENRGLNFLDKPAREYYAVLENALEEKRVSFDKPLVFLLNPPYKNTDENEGLRAASAADYETDADVSALAGGDAGKERYLAFLAQILLIARVHREKTGKSSTIMVFTPTSWLIPRPSYETFRAVWDSEFEYVDGFMIKGDEFFKIGGKWPLAFTIWKGREIPVPGLGNVIRTLDLTGLKRTELDVDWNEEDGNIRKNEILENARAVLPAQKTPVIAKTIPQTMYDFKRDTVKAERELRIVYGGLPLRDPRRTNKKTYGAANAEFPGLMDDCTPVRVKQDKHGRLSPHPNRVWFRLDAPFKDFNKSKCFNAPPDNRGYCAYDLPSAKALFEWFALTKTLNGRYPIWANQLDLWPPTIRPEDQAAWEALCFAFALAENRCVVTKFPAGDPVPEAPEIYLDNPLAPNHPDGFWQNVLEKPVRTSGNGLAVALADAVAEFYKTWNVHYCKGRTLEYVGLQDEPYFKYFDYPDFLTPHSGLIQLKKYAVNENLTDLLKISEEISSLTKAVREELYRLSVVEGNYFG